MSKKNIKEDIVFKKQLNLASPYKYVKEFILLVSSVLLAMLIIVLALGWAKDVSLVWFLMYYTIIGLMISYNVIVNIQNRKEKRPMTFEVILSFLVIAIMVINILITMGKKKTLPQFYLIFLYANLVVSLSFIVFLFLRQYISKMKSVKREKGGLTKVSKILSGSAILVVISLVALVINSSIAVFSGQAQVSSIWDNFNWGLALIMIALISAPIIFYISEKMGWTSVIDSINPYS
jgi:4-hydroxybenzoate polyprenyltransferase